MEATSRRDDQRVQHRQMGPDEYRGLSSARPAADVVARSAEASRISMVSSASAQPRDCSPVADAGRSVARGLRHQVGRA